MMYTALKSYTALMVKIICIPRPRCRFPRTHAHAARGKRRQGFIFYGGIVMDEIAHCCSSSIYDDGADSLHLADHTHTHTRVDGRSLYTYMRLSLTRNNIVKNTTKKRPRENNNNNDNICVPLKMCYYNNI